MNLQGRTHVPKAAKCLQILNTSLLVGIKKGGAPEYVQTGCNKCFRRYTPESQGAESGVKSLSRGLLPRPLMVVWCPQTDSPSWSTTELARTPPGISLTHHSA